MLLMHTTFRQSSGVQAVAFLQKVELAFLGKNHCRLFLQFFDLGPTESAFCAESDSKSLVFCNFDPNRTRIWREVQMTS